MPLVSDEDGRISDAFGTWVEKSMYGRKYMGMERATYLIGADGRVLKAWRKVKVPGHAEEVLKAARELAARPKPASVRRRSCMMHLPVQHVVVHARDRMRSSMAVGALVVGRDAPAAVDVVDRDSLGAEERAVARAGRHHREHMHVLAVEALDRLASPRRGRPARSGDAGVGTPT